MKRYKETIRTERFHPVPVWVPDSVGTEYIVKYKECAVWMLDTDGHT